MYGYGWLALQIDFGALNLALWIPSQISAFFALLTIGYAMAFAKSRKHTMFAMMCFNAFMIVSMGLLQNWPLLAVYCVAILRDVTILWREKHFPKNKPLAIANLLFFLVVIALVAYFTINWHASVALLFLQVGIQLASLFLVYGAWAKGDHLIRISRVCFCSLAIINDIMFSNIVGIAIESFAIVAVGVFYVKRLSKKQGVPTSQCNTQTAQTECGDSPTILGVQGVSTKESQTNKID
ncbi:MAG: YgjV family protein [Firmicutes bacterium]|nr:YgjV family protein [Bacillota bacterium]